MITEVNLDRIAGEICLYLMGNMIDRRPSTLKVDSLAREYIEFWKKHPHRGLYEWLEQTELIQYEEAEDTDF